MGEIEKNSRQEIAESDIGKLSHELTYHKYLLNNDKIRSFFQKLSIPEYLAMHIIKESEQTDDIYAGRTYLKDIADKMQRSVRQTSRMVKTLQERGLVAWSHDGDGSEGTYVTITEAGSRMLQEEEEALKKYYGRVITSYGRENLLHLLQLMKQLETVMSTEFEEMEVGAIEEQGTDE
ncbi:MAG: MarR family transcriptional regulator [Eubacterium sp.]|nr:MarR family transcriptional regulator [Eubacterium sp.]